VIEKGLERLNEVKPDWTLNEETLDMDECYACVLAQNFGSFNKGTKALGIEDDYEKQVDLGFQPVNNAVELRNAWIASWHEKQQKEGKA
jgi:hypothetical protein